MSAKNIEHDSHVLNTVKTFDIQLLKVIAIIDHKIYAYTVCNQLLRTITSSNFITIPYFGST